MPNATAERWSIRDPGFWNPFRPAHRDPDGTVHLHGYAAVAQLLADPTCTTDWYAGADRSALIPVMAGLWMTDGERRRRLRGLLAGHLGPRALAAVQEAVDGAMTDLLAGIVDGHPNRRFEVVGCLGVPLPGRIIGRLLGIEPAAAVEMMTWRDEVWRDGGDLTGMAPHTGMRDQLAALLERQRANPVPGLVGELLAAQAGGFEPVPGESLTDWEIVGQLAMLLWAALGNTSGAVADALLFLTEFGHWPALRAEPDLVPGAVEEVLRWYPSFPAIYRLATTARSIDGLDVPAGTTVVGWLTSAHRDPAGFADPDTFDIRRFPNRHLTFGRGSHFCLGAHFVRMLLHSVVRLTAHHMPELHRDPADQPIRREWIEDSLDHLVMRF